MTNVKKGILVFPILKDLNKADGILVKNEGIRNGFLQNNVEVDVLEFTSQGIFNGNELVYAFHPSRYRRIFQYNFTAWKKILNYLTRHDYDFLWFRIPMATSAIAAFVKGLKKLKPDCTIILEYGAYPYIDELSPFKKRLYRLNKENERTAHQYADFIITYCGQDKVDNLVNIPINNGIELYNIPVVNQEKGIENTINFLSVSSLKKWHAYERFIAGIPAYINRQDVTPIHFNIVGNGPEYDKLVTLTRELGVEPYVTFHNFKTGAELDKIYEQNHLAISTLGFHRIGITNSSSLKNREYFARGLPIVLSTKDMDMPKELPFVLYVPEGEEPIDMEAVVAFAKNAYKQSQLNETIRAYAVENVSWRSKVKEVLGYVNDRRQQIMTAKTIM